MDLATWPFRLLGPLDALDPLGLVGLAHLLRLVRFVRGAHPVHMWAPVARQARDALLRGLHAGDDRAQILETEVPGDLAPPLLPLPHRPDLAPRPRTGPALL